MSCITNARHPDHLGRSVQMELISMPSAEYHRKMAAEYNRLAELATTDQERRNYLRLAEQEMLLANSNSTVWNA